VAVNTEVALVMGVVTQSPTMERMVPVTGLSV
jgi:hypothetical protein